MEIPFTDADVQPARPPRGRARPRRGIEDERIDSVDTVDLPVAKPALLLQKMENKLVRHQLASPDVLSGEELRRLRYILNFARLADFEPGAGGPGRQPRARRRLGGRRDGAVAGPGGRCAVRPAARGA